jgi:hypothetical protein
MNTIRSRSAVLTLALALTGAVPCVAAEAPPAARTFASPQAAVDALRAALKNDDRAALRVIFGPEFRDLLTGDERQDKANSARFSKVLEGVVTPVSENADRVVLEIGADKWPFPIPLIKKDDAWRFDTAAGKQEIVDRHVGKDELHAIGVCEAYGPAQKAFVTGGRGSSGSTKYALKLNSAPGKMDGLYWKPASPDERSPFGANVAAADVTGSAPKPFHGYFFRVLTRQGAAAPGGARDYLKDGALADGFALVAFPERWGRSGIMTFIVNQDGKIYQRDLGPKTSEIASVMTEYDPTPAWTLVSDKGVAEK